MLARLSRGIRRPLNTIIGFADLIRSADTATTPTDRLMEYAGDIRTAMRPLLEQPTEGVPLHSSQYQALPPVYVQNSSLEIAWTRVLDDPGDIAGRTVVPFLTEGEEGFTVDYPDDWERAEALVSRGDAQLPAVAQPEEAA